MSDSLPLSKYHQIYLVLHEQLHEGRFAHGLPAELELARQFAVGRVTVRRALEQLAGEGLIVRKAGRGTRPTTRAEQGVRPRHEAALPGSPVTRLNGLMENIVRVSRSTTVKVLAWELVQASHDLAEALGVLDGQMLRKVVRRRSANVGPVSHITTHMPEALTARISRADLTRKPMLQLLEESGVQLGRAVQTVSAAQADDRIAKELKVAVGTALLSVRRLVHDTNDQPVQLLHGLYRPDRYEYQMEMSQVGSLEARIAPSGLLL